MYLDELVRQAYSYHQQGRFDLAEPLYVQAIAANPEHIDANYLLGVLANQTQKFNQAEGYLRTTIRLNPSHAYAFAELGKTTSYLGRFAESVSLLRHAVGITPSLHTVLDDLATFFINAGLFHPAVDYLRIGTSVAPDSYKSWVHLGCALHGAGKLLDAIESFKNAIRLNPDLTEAYFNLGRSLSQLGHFEEAANALEQVLRIAPDDAETLSLMANQCQHAVLWDRGENLAPRIVEIVKNSDPNNLQDSLGLVEPSSFVTLGWETSPDLQWRCARSWANAKFPIDSAPFLVKLKTDKRIRLGYVSADFRQHVMGTHLVELFEQHDREQFEVLGYSIGPNDESPLRLRLESAFDSFHDLRTSFPEEVARKIHDDQIDILIDLQGYTSLSKPGIFPKKPAPIQVTYLGFPCTMGADYFDYILVDDYVVPEESQRYFTERLVQLPGCYQANDSRFQATDPKPKRSEAGLPESEFVFCSFNNVFKITRRMYDVWMRILAGVEGSVLWLPAFNAGAMKNLKEEASKRNLDPSRIIFAPVLPLAEHHARHTLADLFLDTFPYNAHGTASLSLRSGVPIVTMSGETMASRVAGSLLRELGLSDLITRNPTEYEMLAVRLATNPTILDELKSRLQVGLKSTDLFSGQAFARKVEKAYAVMMDRQLAKQKPKGFQLNRDGSIRWHAANLESSKPC